MICKREYDLVRALNHPNIIKYHGILFNKKENEVNLIMELIPGASLTDLVLYSQILPPNIVSYLLDILLTGLSYLHQNFIIHRDMKPDNVLLTPHGSLKIVDFGTFSQDTSNAARPRSTVGTPWYCAPEVINGDDYSNSADIWSIGCMTFEMISGKPPFDELNDVACLFKMAEGIPPSFPPGISPECNQFLSRTLLAKWQDRPTCQQLLEFPFITSGSPSKQQTRHQLIKILKDMRQVKDAHDKRKFERLTQRMSDQP